MMITHLRRALSAGLLLLGTLLFAQSLGWRGRSFPGFFLLPNRVVPSAGLPGAGDGPSERPLYQSVLTAIDGRPTRSGDALHAAVEAHRPGQAAAYRFERPSGAEERTIVTRTLGGTEHALVFGAYFLTGLAYLVLAAVAAERWSADGLYQALAAFGWASALFTFTALELYGPGHWFRVHAAAETAFLGAGMHLALACPRSRAAGRPGALVLAYGATIAIAIVYELFLYDPFAYVVVHNVVQAAAALPLIVLTVRLGLALGDATSPAELPAVRSVLIGTLAGILVPALVLGISGMSGGSLPVSVAAWFGALFPLSCWPLFRRPATTSVAVAVEHPAPAAAGGRVASGE